MTIGTLHGDMDLCRFHSRTGRRRRWLVATVALGAVLAGLLIWWLRPRHFPVHVDAATAPEQVLDQYVAAVNAHACSDANSLTSGEATRYSLCRPVWTRYSIPHYRIIDTRIDDPRDHAILGGPVHLYVVRTQLQVRQNSQMPEGSSYETLQTFYFGRDTESQTWRIVAIDYL